MKVSVIVCIDGEYADRIEFPIRVYESTERATVAFDELQAISKNYREKTEYKNAHNYKLHEEARQEATAAYKKLGLSLKNCSVTWSLELDVEFIRS